MSHTAFDREFDVVIVGGGSAGCILAARISDMAAIDVGLIEAGPRDTNPWIHIPLGFGRLVPDLKMNWGYETEPEPELNGRRIMWPRGKVLGGSGSINGLVFLRGAPSDYDTWAELGARGWSYREVLPYFKRSEHNLAGHDQWRGEGGPITVSDIKDPSVPSRAFVEACAALQNPRNRDFNGERIDGVGFVQLNVRNGWRDSTATAYLKPVEARANLDVITKAHVRRILIEGRRAVGVEIERGGRVERVRSRREVIVAAGAVASPQLLLASGIGPAKELAAAGVGVLHDLPGVGKNLQDHLFIRMSFRTNAPGTLNEITMSPWKSARMALQWLYRSSGQLAVGAVEATMFARSAPSEPIPDLQFQCVNFSIDSYKFGLHPWPGFMFNFCVCRPKSRGEIRLADPEGRSAPRIHANYLTDPDDWRRMMGGYRIARRIIETEPFARIVTEQVRPGPDCISEDDFKSYIRDNASTVYHPCGSCRMGAADDAMAVVDPELRVRGIDALRVIDASVMPTMPSSNIHPATIMVAEKGADLVKGALV